MLLGSATRNVAWLFVNVSGDVTKNAAGAVGTAVGADILWLEGLVLPLNITATVGLVQALARVEAPVLPLGRSSLAEVGMRVVVGGSGGRKRSVASRIVAKQEFSGYWEYVLDEAIFTAPAHPFWGGTAMIGPSGELLGIGSLQIQQAVSNPKTRTTHKGDDANMIVPIDLLNPIFDDLITIGRPNRPARPWLGLYATEIGSSVAIVGLASRGPAQKADLRAGDVVMAVAGGQVTNLAGLFRSVWAQGAAGVTVPMTINREGRTFDVAVRSVDPNIPSSSRSTR